MSRDGGRGALSFRGRPPSAQFQAREVVIPPRAERPYRDAEWRDALVVIEQGAVELEWIDGRRLRFTRGDVVWLTGLNLRRLGNPDGEPAILSAVSRLGGSNGGRVRPRESRDRTSRG